MLWQFTYWRESARSFICQHYAELRINIQIINAMKIDCQHYARACHNVNGQTRTFESKYTNAKYWIASAMLGHTIVEQQSSGTFIVN